MTDISSVNTTKTSSLKWYIVTTISVQRNDEKLMIEQLFEKS